MSNICPKCKLKKTTYGVWDDGIFNCGNLCGKCDLESKKDDLNGFNVYEK